MLKPVNYLSGLQPMSAARDIYCVDQAADTMSKNEKQSIEAVSKGGSSVKIKAG